MNGFLHGMILAFGLIIPLGVQNIFVFNQGATHKKLKSAMPAVITASVCDTLLILLAVGGVSLIILNFAWFKTVLFTIGILFLLYVGWLLWKNASTFQKQEKFLPFSAKQQILFTMSVSLLNPHAILDTIGVIGTNSLIYSGFEKWSFSFACILISWCWFFGLAYAGKNLGKWIKTENYLSG